MHAALDLGITLFDTADTYRSPDRGVGGISRPGLGARRKDIVLATKFGMPMDEAGVTARCIAPLHHAGGGGQPAAPEHRLDRPLSASITPTR